MPPSPIPRSWLHTLGNPEANALCQPQAPSGPLTLDEQMIYGSSREGIINRGVNLSTATLPTTTFSNLIGDKQYQHSNHLGNVLSTVSDVPLADNGGSGSTLVAWNAYYLSANTYSSFGAKLADGVTNWGTDYRYGFNGMEGDDEVAGNGNSYSAEFWQYDPRLGRRWNIDPMVRKYSWLSPYATFRNNPILYSDRKGLEGEDEHIVEKGESPWSISKDFGISLDQLAEWNPEVFKGYDKAKNKAEYWKNNSKNWIIHPGDKLVVAKPTNLNGEKVMIKVRGGIDKDGYNPNSGYQGKARSNMFIELDPNSPNFYNTAVVQTVTQNNRSSSEGCDFYGPLQKENHLDFVWGPGGLDKCDKNEIYDDPGRCTHPDGPVFFYATTSIVIFHAEDVEVIYTFQYGFTLNPDGTGMTMPVTPYSMEKALEDNNPHFYWIRNVHEHIINGMVLDFNNLRIGF